MKKNTKAYGLIFIALLLLFMIVNLPIFKTVAFFTRSVEVDSNISILTGSLDILLRDSDDINVESKNYIGIMSTSNQVVVKNDFKISNIGSLSSMHSATVLFDGPLSNTDNFKVYLTNKDNQAIELYKDGTYQSLTNFIGFGETFGIKIIYEGIFPQANTNVGMKIVFRGLQTNDNVNSPKMFVDTENIHYDIQMNADNGTWLDVGKGFKVNYEQLDMYFGKNSEENTVNLNDGILKIQVPEGTNPSDYKFNFENGLSQSGVIFKSYKANENIITVNYGIDYLNTGYTRKDLLNNINIQIPITKNSDSSFSHKINLTNVAFTRKVMLSTDSPIDLAKAPSYERDILIKKDDTIQISIKYIERILSYSPMGWVLSNLTPNKGEILGVNTGNKQFTTSIANNKIFITANNNSINDFNLRITLKGNSGNTLIFKRLVNVNKNP